MQEEASEVQARLLSTELKALDKVYPRYLSLKQLVLVHRHGDRTPLSPRFLDFLPLNWNFCSLSNKKVSILPNYPQNSSNLPNGTFSSLPFLKVAEGGDSCINDHSALTVPQTIINTSTCTYGQLTDVGRRTLSRNGEHFRKIYVDYLGFLPKNISELKAQELYFRTTDYPRTIESLQHLITGIFSSDKVTAGSNIVIRSRDHINENLYLDFKCKRLVELRKQITSSLKTSLTENWLKLRQNLINSTELSTVLSSSEFDSPSGIHKLFDSFMCARAHNLNLPKGITNNHLNQLEKLQVEFWFGAFKDSKELVRLGIGRLYSEIANHIKSSALGSEAVKLAIYSGHDTTIGPLLIGLGIFDDRWPPFGATIGVELFKDSEENNLIEENKQSFANKYENYYIRVRYNDKFKEIPYCKVSGRHHPRAGPSFCRLENFLELINELSPSQYNQECHEFKDEISDR